MVTMGVTGFVFMIVGIVFLVGLIATALTFFLTKRAFEKQIKENPPVSEKMIRIMFKQMGRTASETQIRQIMRSMQNAKYDNKNK
ncbi:YneF family protein [Mycoplasmopsis cricetuli]|uniref:YneF family protein n=1 Tax=Mycoplasmopsis cricetuli TaxID=171283 RepID=UPI00047155EF|nr:YneF family protein [Mycoplasmopsis cricetuli]